MPKNSLHTLTLSFDESLRYKLYDSVFLSLEGGLPFRAEWRMNIATKQFTYRWDNLPGGNYSLRVKDIFGYTEMYRFYLRKDTAITERTRYQLVAEVNATLPDYKKYDSIQLYYKVDGCFSDFKQRFLAVKSDNSNYRCTYTKDSFVEVETMGRTRMHEVPVYARQTAGSAVIDDITALVAICSKQSRGCGISTTRKQLFVLAGDRLFQFSDSEACDWDGFTEFVHRYFPYQKE